MLPALCLLPIGSLDAREPSKLPATPLQRLLGRGGDQKIELGLEDYENALRNHPGELFSEVPDFDKYLLVRELCEGLKKNPQAAKLEPLLLKEILARKVFGGPPADWNEVAMATHGGAVGLLMECVMSISGEAGFNRIFDSLIAPEDAARLKILLLQVSIRRERAKYDPVLEEKVKTLQSAKLKEAIEAHLKAAATGS